MAEYISGVLPVVPLRNRVIFPWAIEEIEIGRTFSHHAIERASSTNACFFAVAQKDSSKNQITLDNLEEVGTVVRIVRIARLQNGNLKVIVKGLNRGKISYLENDDYCIMADVTAVESVISNVEMLDVAYRQYIINTLKDLSEASGKPDKAAIIKYQDIEECEKLIDTIGANMFSIENKQKLLNEANVAKRADMVIDLIVYEQEIANLQKKIQKRVKESIDKGQRDFYLREQLKAIHKELGDDEEERITLEEQIEKSDMPEDIKAKVKKELVKMCRMSSASPDYNVIRMYIEWMLDIPWSTRKKVEVDLPSAIKILEQDHYGLEKIKERIIEYIAVLLMNGGKTSQMPILCFVGPPGVGKTSIATSIARALDRKFVRMSLGGVRDEAEIRGHRKTYVGAMPGRIIAAMKQAGTNNPLFLLDEIDKLSSDIHGDPSSALLEVLDPNQNDTFRDRYLEVPYDLSNVLFITTANSLEDIPAPLLDRMEVIELGSYTYAEKREIAKRYLIPRKAQLNCFDEGELTFTDEAIDEIITGYTLEAGVRNLERKIDAVCRKIAVKKAAKRRYKKRIEKGDIATLLGARRFDDENMLEEDEVGIATGLAWTWAGGTTLNIEVAPIKGKGEIILTGQLGDVMKESARAAITYIHAHADEYGIAYETFENTDLHIHIPEGATPKDGPSAGITMATAILSALTGKSVKRSIAMTGEITLRGKVLPIGGLKEKSMAAYRIGIKKVLIPQANVKDLEEVADVVKKQVEFIPVKSVSEVFSMAINF